MAREGVRSYGQFCPVAMASEVLTQRWTPLVLRELLCGSTHFNELRRGVPLMSPSLLTRRLRTLEDAGVLERRVDERARSTEYRLTRAGEALRPLIEQIGVWGRRWIQREVTEQELDPALLMWDMRRRIRVDTVPSKRVVVRFEYTDVESKLGRWWLVMEPGKVDLCLSDPGFPTDLRVTTTVRLMTSIWLGHTDFRRSVGPGLRVQGPGPLVRALPGWLELSVFAKVERYKGPTPRRRRAGTPP